MEVSQLIGKKIEELTPAELATLQSKLVELTSQITVRQAEVKSKAEQSTFAEITNLAAKLMKEKLGWGKLPKLAINPNEAGDIYVLSYVAIKKPKKTGTSKGRGPSDVNNGDITINKIVMAMGGVDKFLLAGQEFESVKDVVKALQAAGDSRKAWELDKAGISISDYILHYHPKEVSIRFVNGIVMSAEEAAKKLDEARKKAATEPEPELDEI